MVYVSVVSAKLACLSPCRVYFAIEMAKVSFVQNPALGECSLSPEVKNRWIDAKTGKRSDVAHHFIYDRERENLQVVTGVHVKRVIFEYAFLGLVPTLTS
jgi:hypothetical protein